METRDDSAHFQETTEGLSVPHLMCWRTEGTFTIAWRCCDIFVILAPDTKLQTDLLTYWALYHPQDHRCKPAQKFEGDENWLESK